MTTLSRWLAPVALAAGLGAATMAASPTARADDDLVRVIVDVADVVLRGGTPYYRHGNYGYKDRLAVRRDRYGRPIYYRSVPRHYRSYRSGPPAHAPAHGYYKNRGRNCNRNGRCRVEYYDSRYDRDRDRYRDRRGRYDARWDGRRRR